MRRGATLWDQLTPAERASWLQDEPERAAASRDGREAAPVSFGRVDMPARVKAVPLPELVERKLDRAKKARK